MAEPVRTDRGITVSVTGFAVCVAIILGALALYFSLHRHCHEATHYNSGCCCCGGSMYGNQGGQGGYPDISMSGRFGGNPGTIITTVSGNLIDHPDPTNLTKTFVKIDVDPNATNGTSLPVTIMFTSDLSDAPKITLRGPNSHGDMSAWAIAAGSSPFVIQPRNGSAVEFTLEWTYPVPPAPPAWSWTTTNTGQQYYGAIRINSNDVAVVLINP